MNDKDLRDHLMAMLTRPNAHATFETVTEIPPRFHGYVIEGFPHSPWQLVEHLRIAQWDIMEFSRNPDHESPDFPSGYWPGTAEPPTDSSWEESLSRFNDDLQAMVELISNPGVDLFERFPWGDGQTLVREALVLAKHNSYHIGQLGMLKKAFESGR